MQPRIIIFGLGAGGADDITLGMLRRMKSLAVDGVPIFLRTSKHPSVKLLEAEGVSFAAAFDTVYEESPTFDIVYRTIVDRLTEFAGESGTVGYAVPGHPLVGEQSVRLLLARQDQIEVDLVSATSFFDVCLIAARQESAQLVIVDALTLPDPTDNFRTSRQPFNAAYTHLIYQVYDRQIASAAKLALLELYDPQTEVTIVQAAGVADVQTVTQTPLHRLDHISHSFDHLTTIVIPPQPDPRLNTQFETLLDIMSQLRNPKTGCPWDREQSPQTLKRYAVEEVYELLDAIDEGDVDHYIEELGDLLLQVVFHAQLAREAGDFTVDDVIKTISEKMVRRHPHVFGSVSVEDSQEVLANWEVIKKSEKGNHHRTSRLDGVPNHLPALARAQGISKRAAKAGFEWESIEGVFAKVEEETLEFKDALAAGKTDHAADELGDLLFSVVNLARFAKVDAEDALRRMVRRFEKRFRSMEAGSPKPLEELNAEEFESLWQAAKREESSSRLDIE